MTNRLKFVLFVLICSLKSCQITPEPIKVTPEKTLARTIITTDGEIDDVDSFVRLLLYANEMSIEGLVYSSSQWHYKGDGLGTSFTSEIQMTKELYGSRTSLRWPGTEWIQDLISAYAEVYDNLILHDSKYPHPDQLRNQIYVGNIDFEGEMSKDTEGSNFIKAKLLDDERSPLYLQVWGGTNTIARALKSIEDEFWGTPTWNEVYQKVTQKAVIYAILDQDATYKNYISKKWPDVKVYYNSNQFWSFAYFWKRVVPEDYRSYLKAEFMSDLINNHGPLLKKYYSYGDGQKQEGDPEHIHGDPNRLVNAQWGTFEPYDFISEGDSPAFLHLVDVGLQNLEHPEYGGWGGRLVQLDSTLPFWSDGEHTAEYNPFTKTMDLSYAQTRWIPAIQNDFAARADWCISDYSSANHAPSFKLAETKIKVRPSEQNQIELKYTVDDPDADQWTMSYFFYDELSEVKMSNYPKVSIENDQITLSDFDPETKAGVYHLIFEVKDRGSPPLSSYQRLLIELE